MPRHDVCCFAEGEYGVGKTERKQAPHVGWTAVVWHMCWFLQYRPVSLAVRSMKTKLRVGGRAGGKTESSKGRLEAGQFRSLCS